MRADGRAADELRDVRITPDWINTAEGSALVEFGNTRVLCAASLTEGVPRWLKGQGRGWVTAEYAMLPRATDSRSTRESVKGKQGGRTHEISRLIGRSLRAIIDMDKLGENTLVLDVGVPVGTYAYTFVRSRYGYRRLTADDGYPEAGPARYLVERRFEPLVGVLVRLP